MSKDYTVVTWADGFARWHAKAVFSTALGNLPEAEAVASRAIKACKVAIRREISERMAPKQCRRLMTLEQIEQAYNAALVAERVARITAQHAELELQDATLKADRARRAYCEATLNPEQIAFREWHATYRAKESVGAKQ